MNSFHMGLFLALHMHDKIFLHIYNKIIKKLMMNSSTNIVCAYITCTRWNCIWAMTLPWNTDHALHYKAKCTELWEKFESNCLQKLLLWRYEALHRAERKWNKSKHIFVCVNKDSSNYKYKTWYLRHRIEFTAWTIIFLLSQNLYITPQVQVVIIHTAFTYKYFDQVFIIHTAFTYNYFDCIYNLK